MIISTFFLIILSNHTQKKIIINKLKKLNLIQFMNEFNNKINSIIIGTTHNKFIQSIKKNHLIIIIKFKDFFLFIQKIQQKKIKIISYKFYELNQYFTYPGELNYLFYFLHKNLIQKNYYNFFDQIRRLDLI